MNDEARMTNSRIRKQVKAGKPSFRVLPPEKVEKAVSSEGAAEHLYRGRGVSPSPAYKGEWKGLG